MISDNVRAASYAMACSSRGEGDLNNSFCVHAGCCARPAAHSTSSATRTPASQGRMDESHAKIADSGTASDWILEARVESQVAYRSLTWLNKAAAHCTTYPVAYPGAQMHQCIPARGTLDAFICIRNHRRVRSSCARLASLG